MFKLRDTKFPNVDINKHMRFYKINGWIKTSEYIFHESLYKKINAFDDTLKLTDGCYMYGKQTDTYKKDACIIDIKEPSKYKEPKLYEKGHRIKRNNVNNKYSYNALDLKPIKGTKIISVDFKFNEILWIIDKIELVNKEERIKLYLKNKCVGLIYGEKEFSFKKLKNNLIYWVDEPKIQLGRKL